MLRRADEPLVLDFIQPGTPAQNAFIERFNQTYRSEVLDATLFTSLAEVRSITTDWLRRYNTQRLLEPLGYLPPVEYEEQYHRASVADATEGALT